jgi:nucleoside-diphosphate-sugar epimerase
LILISGGNSRLAKYVKEAIPGARALGHKDCDITTDYSKNDLARKLKGASAVINTAGRVFGTRDELWKSNFGVVESIVSALPKGCRLVQISSVSVYGKDLASKPANEETPLRPDSDYARSKAQAEALIRKGVERHTILRPGPIYGSRYEDYMKMMAMCAKGKAAIIGKGNNIIPFTGARDVANAAKLAIGEGADGTFVIAGTRITQEGAMGTMARELGVRIKKRIPYWAAKVYAAYCEYIGKCFMNFERLDIMAKDRPFSTAKAEKAMGFKPSDTREGIRQMALFYKSGGMHGKGI